MNESEKHIGFSLTEAARLLQLTFETKAKALGLAPLEAYALIYIERYDGIRQTDLTDRLRVQPITLSRLLQKLVREGRVERRDDPRDKRAKNLHIAAGGQGLVDQLSVARKETRTDALKGFSPPDIERFYADLQRVIDNFATKMEEEKLASDRRRKR